MSQNISMTLYYKEVRQNAQNTYYPCKIEVHDSKDLERVIVWDHVCAEYNNYINYCKCNGEHTYSASAFKKALEEKGFKYDRNNKNRFYYGLRLLTEI